MSVCKYSSVDNPTQEGTLVHMFRELMNYCVTMSVSSGSYSLPLQHSSTHSFVILSF